MTSAAESGSRAARRPRTCKINAAKLACIAPKALLGARSYPEPDPFGPIMMCGRGGTGRRATLRSLWPKGRGSSSLLDRTIIAILWPILNDLAIFRLLPAHLPAHLYDCLSALILWPSARCNGRISFKLLLFWLNSPILTAATGQFRPARFRLRIRKIEVTRDRLGGVHLQFGDTSLYRTSH